MKSAPSTAFNVNYYSTTLAFDTIVQFEVYYLIYTFILSTNK